MNDSLGDIRRYVQALVGRERLLLLARVSLQAVALLAGLLLLAIVAAAFRWDRGLAALVLVALGGAGLWAAVVAPLVIGWRRTGDAVRQARLAEALRPTLEGRLLTTVERLDGPRGQESAAVLGLIARRAQERLKGLSPGRVHRAWPVAALTGGVFVSMLVTLCAGVFSPGGIAGAVRFWTGSDDAIAAADVELRGGVDHARVGDLVLEYVYPAYTGLEPLEVTNSTGEAHGPPGTQVRVRVRSAEPVDNAAVVAYDEPGADTTVDERIVRGTFTIQDEPGEWYLELLRGEQTRTSRTFPISPEPDLPPEVIVDAERRMEVALDAPLRLPWSTRDDYGLTRITLVVDGKEELELRTFDEAAVEASGTVDFTPQQLGMSAGMVVEVQVGAWDNNGWAGSQLGLSEPPIQLVVKRAEDLRSLGPEEREELRDTLVDLLAGQLLDPWPPAGTSAAVARSGERFDGLYDGLVAFLERTPAVYRDRQVRRIVGRVRTSGRDFVTYTQVNFDAREAETVAGSERLARAGELRELAVYENEHAIVWLDRFMQMRALGQVVEEAETLARVGGTLERELARGASDQEIASALERVERSVQSLQEATAAMNEDSTKSMVQRRTREIDLIRQSVMKAREAGDAERAAQLAERMARQMKELDEDLKYRLKRLEDEESGLGEEMKSLIEELQRMEREQRQLQDEVRDVRESGDAQGAAEAERLWNEVERLAAEAEDRGEDLEERMQDGLFMYRTRVEAANDATARLVESAAARDLRRATSDVNEALRHWIRSQTGVPEGARRQVTRRLEQAQRLLDQLARESAAVDPRTAAQARALESRQRELDEALEKARELARDLESKMPIEPRGMNEALEDAERAMGQASDDLNQGQPMPAEGSQGQAAQKLKEARESLEQAAAEMQASGEGARSGEPSDGEGGGPDEAEQQGEFNLDGTQGSIADKSLTLEDEFDLDAFQRDVLRGARGDVPEAYRAMKKRYYEELMTQ